MNTGLPCGDFHVHSFYSDGSVSPEQIVQVALRKKMTVVSKADHDTIRGNQKLGALCREKGLLFIPGIEVSSKDGHIVILGVDRWVHGRFSAEETAEKAHDLGGVAILAHPFYKGCLRERGFGTKKIDAIELLNGATIVGNLICLKKFAQLPIRPGLTLMVGSDSHGGVMIGDYVNEFQCENARDAILDAIQHGQVKIRAPIFPLRGWLADGAPNQVYLLRRLILYRRARPRTEKYQAPAGHRL